MVLALAALGLAARLRRSGARTEAALAQSRADQAALREHLDMLHRRLARAEPRPAGTPYVITGLGRERPTGTDPTAVTIPTAAGAQAGGTTPAIGRALFADLVLRETVVKAASLAYGIRRGLDPETRNRIRFEMRREVRRSRRQRKADTRQAVREWKARQRAGLGGDPA